MFDSLNFGFSLTRFFQSASLAAFDMKQERFENIGGVVLPLRKKKFGSFLSEKENIKYYCNTSFQLNNIACTAAVTVESLTSSFAIKKLASTKIRSHYKIK